MTVLEKTRWLESKSNDFYSIMIYKIILVLKLCTSNCRNSGPLKFIVCNIPTFKRVTHM